MAMMTRWLLLVLLGLPLARSAQAQAEYRNLDAGFPVRVEDATVTERYAFDLDLANIRFDALSGNRKRLQLEPQFSYGILPYTEMWLRVPVYYRESYDHSPERNCGRWGGRNVSVVVRESASSRSRVCVGSVLSDRSRCFAGCLLLQDTFHQEPFEHADSPQRESGVLRDSIGGRLPRPPRRLGLRRSRRTISAPVRWSLYDRIAVGGTSVAFVRGARHRRQTKMSSRRPRQTGWLPTRTGWLEWRRTKLSRSGRLCLWPMLSPSDSRASAGELI